MIWITYRKPGGIQHQDMVARRTGEVWWLTASGDSVHRMDISDGLAAAQALPIERSAARPVAALHHNARRTP